MSTCAIHEGLLYTADLNGVVYCFDANTGKKYWEEDTMRRYGVAVLGRWQDLHRQR